MLNIVVLTKKKLRKEERKKEGEKWHFQNCTLLHLAVSCVPFGHLYMSLADHKGTQRGRLGFVVKLYGFSLRVVYIVCRCHPYIDL